MTSRVIVSPTVAAATERFIDGTGLFAVFASRFQHRLLVTKTSHLGAYRRCHASLVVVHGHQIKSVKRYR